MYRILIDAGTEGMYFYESKRDDNGFVTAEEALSVAMELTCCSFIIIKIIKFREAE